MSKKLNPELKPKAPICKELDCFEAASIKGFCRLHFIKALAGKGTENATDKDSVAGTRERRRSDRFKGPETSMEVEELDPLALELVTGGELDTDIEDLDLDPAAGMRKKKAG